MIIEFTVENYRSIKSAQTLSMIADSGRKKSDNVADLGELRLLKSAVIYGHNASGKSNVIQAFHDFSYLIENSLSLKRGEKIDLYQPFRLNKTTLQQPTSFCLDFIYDHVKYTYQFSYTQESFVEERLEKYSNFSSEKGQALFSRQGDNITLGKELANLENETQILSNHLFLPEIGGTSDKHKLLGDLFLYFRKARVWNATDTMGMTLITKAVTKGLIEEGNQSWKEALRKLIKVADIKIEGITTKETTAEEYTFPESIPEEVRSDFIEQNRYKAFITHQAFDDDKNTSDLIKFDLEDESEGTKSLFALGGLLLAALEKGNIIFVDELENSLHYKLSRFLVKLFHHPKTNPNNTQLIFATHETTLLSKGLFRKDQIWFTKKDKYGETDLYSAQDFDEVRDDTPFDKWHKEDKFNTEPNIKELEFIFGNE